MSTGIGRGGNFATFRDVAAPRVTRVPAPIEDKVLSAAMQAAQAGDRDAYRDLLKACLPIVVSMVRAQGIRGASVDDVVQDVLLTVHRARATYDPTRPLLPWLRAISQRRAIDHIRRSSRHSQEVSNDFAYEGWPDDAVAPDVALGTRQQMAHVVTAVADLPNGQRQAVEHLVLRGLSPAEAAVMTGRSAGALKVNLHRALKVLRTSLSSISGKING